MMTVLTAEGWNRFYDGFPDAHLLQSGQWGQLKTRFGWDPVWVQNGSSGAQLLFRQLPLGFTIAYIPKGPIGMGWRELWPVVDPICRKRRAVFLRVEPDLLEGEGQDLLTSLEGFVPAAESIQPRRTILIDLSGDENDWLERMKQKTRYNIRLAQKKEITVRPSDNLNEFFSLMKTTGQRDGFGVHTQLYYQLAYDLFRKQGECALLVAEYRQTPLAALMVFKRGPRAWYFYGASSDEERQRMPAYLLQFEAMRWAASRGCRSYDLWGVPDCDETELEASFSSRSDGLWGVYRFKRGFGGQLVRAVGAWDRIYQPGLYRLYQFWQTRRKAEGE